MIKGKYKIMAGMCCDEDKRIWIVIGCILFIGTECYPLYQILCEQPGAAMMAEITAGAEDCTARLPLPRLWDSR